MFIKNVTPATPSPYDSDSYPGQAKIRLEYCWNCFTAHTTKLFSNSWFEPCRNNEHRIVTIVQYGVTRATEKDSKQRTRHAVSNDACSQKPNWDHENCLRTYLLPSRLLTEEALAILLHCCISRLLVYGNPDYSACFTKTTMVIHT